MKVEGTKHVALRWYSCCGARFPFALGKYGCVNCEGEKAARVIAE
tara:strand:+ start:4323 stop:4457 length:135 start_codon:yes stop_codon:yes gene_type:complete